MRNVKSRNNDIDRRLRIAKEFPPKSGWETRSMGHMSYSPGHKKPDSNRGGGAKPPSK